MSCKSKKPRKVRQKKKKKNWGWQLSSWQMFFFGGGKCPNLGVVNVRILGVVNVRLANNLTPFPGICPLSERFFSFFHPEAQGLSSIL